MLKLGMDTNSKDGSLKRFSDYIFIFAIFLVFIIAITTSYQFNKISRSINWVNHTYEVLLTANNTISTYNYIESKQREYILFNDTDALENFNLHVKKINNLLNYLTTLTKDNPEQNKRVKDYIQIFDERLKIFNLVINLKKTNQYPDAVKNELFSKTKVIAGELDRISQEFVSNEKLLLEERNSIFLKEFNFVNLVVMLAQITSILFLIAAFFASHRAFKRRAEMEQSNRLLSSKLRSIIEGANDMFVALDNQFCYLIFNEAYKEEFKKLFGEDIEVGKSIAEVLKNHPKEKETLLNLWKNSLAGKDAIKTVQFPISGIINTYEITPSLIKMEDGTTLGALHIIRNITERIKEQDMLKSSYEKLNAATVDLKNKNEKITLLLEMSDVLLVTDSVDELKLVIPTYCKKILSFSSGNFYIMRPSKDLLELSGQWGTPVIASDVFTPNQCWSLRLGRTHHSILKHSDLLCEHIKLNKDFEIGYLCLPLRAQNEVLGLLYIEYNNSNNKQLSETELLLTNAFAEVLALALANIRLRENLRYQSIRDPLTGLYNRRYLEEFLSNQLFLAEREQTPLTVLIMDLDHFKRVNDIHGHDAGDAVLKEFSHLLLKFVRRSDLATRFGGEEFIVVFFNASKNESLKRAEELRNEVAHLNIKYGNQDIHITLSIGISSFPENAKEGKTLIELADAALYAAKKNGRDQVRHYDELAENPNIKD